MDTSEKGIVALVDEEGEPLKAYLCPAGHWTIGAGLTAASGVIKPKAGMRITREESRRLLALALDRNYEPAVERAMGQPKQHEFDAGVLFHWNTGAIGKASWVKRWLECASPAAIRAALAMWNKGGGKVLPGLTRRRQREADMLLLGVYPAAAPAARSQPGLVWAAWGLSLSPAEMAATRAALRRLGYDVGDKLDAIWRHAVEAFQKDHDLTVDGIIGRATLSALQRRIDAGERAVKPAVATVVATPVATVGGEPDLTDQIAPGLSETIANLAWIEPIVFGGLALWIAYLAYSYRDVIAAKTANHLPRLAALLRSF